MSDTDKSAPPIEEYVEDIKGLLLLKGMSQLKLATLNDVRPSNLSNWLKGVQNVIGSEKRREIAESLGFTVHQEAGGKLINLNLNPHVVHEWVFPPNGKSTETKRWEEVASKLLSIDLKSPVNDSTTTSQPLIRLLFKKDKASRDDEGLVVIQTYINNQIDTNIATAICIRMRNISEFVKHWRHPLIEAVDLGDDVAELSAASLLDKNDGVRIESDRFSPEMRQLSGYRDKNGDFKIESNGSDLYEEIQTIIDAKNVAYSKLKEAEIGSIKDIEKAVSDGVKQIDALIKILNHEKEQLSQILLLSNELSLAHFKRKLDEELQKLSYFKKTEEK